MAIDLTCFWCGNSYTKSIGEYNRQRSRGAERFYCTQGCAARQRNKDNPPRGNVLNLCSDNLRDELTPFRWFQARVRSRARKGPSDLTLEFLRVLWGTQQGRCAFTGWEMILPVSTTGFAVRDPRNASLDRIDNTQGYVEGNVRYVSYMANIARSTFTDNQLREFCRAVSNQPI